MLLSMNQSAPSGPVRIPHPSPDPLTKYSVNDPVVVTFATSTPVGALFSVTHKLPSGPVVMPRGRAPLGDVNSVMCPEGVTRATFPAVASASQMFPSGPSVINAG